MSILTPFMKQLHWSRPKQGVVNTYNLQGSNWDNKPFSYFSADFRAEILQELKKSQGWDWNKPVENFFNDLMVAYLGGSLSNVFLRWQYDRGEPVLHFSWRNPAYTLFSLLSSLLMLGHLILRGTVGLPGALFEVAERAAERHWSLMPLKLLFYLLKQPFKWAETAISAGIYLVDGLLGSIYSLVCFFSSKSRAKELWNKVVERTVPAAVQLLLAGLIGVAGYLLGPLGVFALAGTLGVGGAGLAVAAIGTVGATTIQAAALGGGNCCSTAKVLFSQKEHQPNNVVEEGASLGSSNNNENDGSHASSIPPLFSEDEEQEQAHDEGLVYQSGGTSKKAG